MGDDAADDDDCDVSVPPSGLADAYREIFFDRETITRRVESVSFLPGVVRERRISLDVDLALVLEAYERAGISSCDVARRSTHFPAKGSDI